MTIMHPIFLKTRYFFLCLIIILCIVNTTDAQFANNPFPFSTLTQKGIIALKTGDSLEAFHLLESAYALDQSNEDINYYFLSLSLALGKSAILPEAKYWVQTTKNAIYKSRLQFALGNYHFNQLAVADAIDAYSQVQIEDLQNEEIVQMKFNQGYLYFKEGNWEKAGLILNALRQVNDNKYYTNANYFAGFIALEKKEYNLALDCFKIASINGQYAMLTPFYISQLHYFLGDIEAALINTQKALTQKGQFYESQLQQLMGHLLFEKKSYAEALPYLENYISKQEKVETQDLYQLSFCYFQSQDWTKAIIGFKQLATIEDSIGQNSMYLLATSFLKMNDKNGAKNAFLLCATNSLNKVQKEIALYNYIKLSIELKEYSNALNSIEKFESTYINSIYLAEIKNLYISALSLSNNFIKAFEIFETMDSISDDLIKLYPNVLYGRACLFINDGETEKAYTLLNKLLSIPYNLNLLPKANFWIGELSYKMGRILETISSLESFIANPTENGEVNLLNANYTLAYAYLKSNNYQTALKIFTKISNLTSPAFYTMIHKDAFVRMADCQLMLKQFKIALTSFDKIINTSWPYVDYAQIQKANILGGMGKNNDKIKILSTFETNYPNSTYLNDARMELAETFIAQESFQFAIAPLTQILLDKKEIAFHAKAFYKLGIVYFNLNKNEAAILTFKDLYLNYPAAIETENATEFVRNIYIEDQTPELFVKFMNDYNKPLSLNEQDSLIYRAAIIKYEQKKYIESVNGFLKYLYTFPNGKYNLDAKNFIAEIYYAQDIYDSAAYYFGKVANQAPNPFAERAALIAARLNYFNLNDFVLAEKYFNTLLQFSTQHESKMEAFKGLLRCYYKSEKWYDGAKIATAVLEDHGSAIDDIMMANMTIYHQSLLNGDTTTSIQKLEKIISYNSSLITAEAHYELAKVYFLSNQLNFAEKTAFDAIKKQAAYEFWVTKSYLLLGDIYIAQNDLFNAIATFKSIAENANIPELQKIAIDKLKSVSEQSSIK